MRRIGTLLPLLPLLAATSARADQIAYVVQRGDNPWNLTQRYLKGVAYWPRLQQLNHVQDAAHIPPGTVLHIPVEWLRLSSTSVQVISAHGDAVVSAGADPAAAEVAVVAGMSLRAGQRVQTRSGATVALQFADGSRVLLLPDGLLQIARADALAAGGGSVLRLTLLRGTLENRVRPRSGPGGRFEIDTPSAVAAVRGTEFRVSAQPGAALTEVLGGLVNFGNKAGQLDVPAGFGTLAHADHRPAELTALLPPPDIAGVPALVERLPLDVPIPAVDGAVAYRTQLATDLDFAAMLSAETSTAPRVRAGDVPDGRYHYRVRAIDPAGMEGRSAEGELTVHARPEPPVLLSPPDGETLVEARPELLWTARAGQAGYRLQLARDREFNALVADIAALEEPHWQAAQDLPVGEYWWRVSTHTEREGAGPQGDPARFMRVLPGPDLAPPLVKDGDTLFAWSSAGADARYHLQLAQDADFAQPLLDEVLDQPRYTWHAPKPGTYHLRVAALGGADLAGPWGPAQTVQVAEPRRFPWWLLLLPALFAL